ncbi:MAG: hypothetical protein DRO96_01545 [Candidatus Aenigmatarchaeota archaeon]|nr:MAG: hypothetical protein DRO96_01545 [Candidatus Aenigmarchaeota archaeon]
MEQIKLYDFDEFGSLQETAYAEFASVNEEIESFAQEAINEENRQSEEILIEEELQEQGIPEHIIQELTERGIDLLEGNTPQQQNTSEKSFVPLQKSSGSEGSPRPWHYPTDVKKYKDPPWPKGDKSSYTPSRRERLEATKSGMQEYLDSDYVTEDKRDQFTEQLEKIEEELELLPPHPEEKPIEIEDVSDEEAQSEGWRDNHERKHWKEGTAAHAKFLDDTSRKQKLNAIKTKLSAGITNEDLAECGSAIQKSVARAHLPLKMWPEYRNEPYDPEFYDEELQRYINSEKDNSTEDEDNTESEEEYDSEENTEEAFSYEEE